MSSPRVSIVVPTVGRPAQLASCLDSIDATVDLPHEVICVTVAGDDATGEVVSGRSVTVIEQAERSGFVRAANAGFRAATGHYLMQVNDDCELLPHSVANAIRCLEAPAHAHVGQVAFFHNSPLTRNIHAQVQLECEWFHVAHVRGLCYANFGLARRELCERLDHFDERYVMYGADPDFSLKVWHEAKLAVLPCPGALIRHRQLDDERAADERARQDEDNRKLFEKWRL